MKIRFTSQKEREPTVDGGLKVIYAPSKRAAYKIRWYLILLLVASPVLWFAGKMVGNLLLVEAPARTFQPVLRVRAMEVGRVQQLHVAEGDAVSAGTTLISLENPTLQAQHQAVSVTLSAATPLSPAMSQQFEAYTQQMERARWRVAELEHLVGMGAATRGELAQAQDRLNEHESALAALRQRLEPSATQLAQEKNRLSEVRLLNARLDTLQVRADTDAIVQNLAVHEGEDVGPGTLMMDLITNNKLEVHVFLDVQERKLASQGQTLRLRLPDDQWIDARVTEEPKGLIRLPPELRSPIARSELSLLVKVEPMEPLPLAWQINNVPMTARFPNQLQRWLQEYAPALATQRDL